MILEELEMKKKTYSTKFFKKTYIFFTGIKNNIYTKRKKVAYLFC